MKANERLLTALLITCVWAICSTFSLSLAETKSHDSNPLINVVWQTLKFHFHNIGNKDRSLNKFLQQLPVPAQCRHPSGVFVTLTRNGKPRACWGSVFPQQEDLVKATAYATIDALTKEYRYPPINRSELPKLRASVTVIHSLEPILAITGQNPLEDGLMVRSGGKTGILLPGEARDPYYQLVACKLKAGIKPHEPCQLYKIRASQYE